MVAIMDEYPIEREQRLSLLVLAVVTGVMLFLYGRIDFANEAFREWDSRIYLRMAVASPHLDPAIPRPFAFRILGPYLVGLVPGPAENSFYAVNLLLSVLLVYLLYRFMRYLGLRPAFACIAACLYVLNKHLFGFTTWNCFHIDDVLANVFLIVLFWSELESRWLVFGAVLCVSVAARETTILMIPAGFLALLERRTLRRDAPAFLGAAAAGLAAFVAMRLFIHPATGVTMREALASHWTKITSLDRMYHVLVNPFVPLSFVPLVFPGRTLAFFRGRAHFLFFALLVAGTPLFGHNNERLLNPAAVVFYALIGFILRDCVWPARWPIGVALAGGVLSSFHWLVARYPLPSRHAAIALSGGSLIAVTLALVVFRVLRDRGGRSAGVGSAS
jgi:hypothetical protein